MTNLAAAVLCLPAFALAAPPELAIQETLPAGLAVDGDLKEWKTPASIRLGAGNQVAGPSKVASAADLTADVWIAISKDGLAVAGKVTDDRLKLPEGSKVIHADHVEVWLALPAAPMPPLAYANQFGEIEVPDAEACDTLEEIEDPAACKAWVKEQRRRRQSLERLFLRQYLLTPAGIREEWSTNARDGKEPEFPQKACCAASKAVVKAAPGGWVFEALIAASDFPASGQTPLRDFGLLVDLVDADEGIDKLETFLSTSARRKLGRSTTFNAITLKTPISWETDPPLLAYFGKGHDLFYFPGSPVGSAFTFDNHPVGYQYQPKEPSPTVHEMKISGEPVAKLGAIEVHWTASPHGRALYTFRGDQVVDGVSTDGDLVAHVKRAGTDAMHVLVYHEGTQSELGTGACGSCPLHELRVYSIDKTGAVTELLEEEIPESVAGDDGAMLENLKFEQEKEFVRIGFSGERVSEEDGARTPWSKHWRWDASKKTYVPAK